MRVSKTMMRGKPDKWSKVWNRCDVCGRFIAFADFNKGAVRDLVYQDTHFTVATYETLCGEHGHLAWGGIFDECAKQTGILPKRARAILEDHGYSAYSHICIEDALDVVRFILRAAS